MDIIHSEEMSRILSKLKSLKHVQLILSVSEADEASWESPETQSKTRGKDTQQLQSVVTL